MLTQYMTAGNLLCRTLGRRDAFALLAVGAIRAFRQVRTGDVHKPDSQQAYILHSLKRPEEVESLRKYMDLPSSWLLLILQGKKGSVSLRLRLPNPISHTKL
jgi:hypothetical protein